MFQTTKEGHNHFEIILEKKMRHPNTTHILTEASMKLTFPPLFIRIVIL